MGSTVCSANRPILGAGGYSRVQAAAAISPAQGSVKKAGDSRQVDAFHLARPIDSLICS